MAVRAGAAYVDVLPDVRGFAKRLSTEMRPALARAEADTRGFRSRVSSAFGSVASAGLRAFALVGAAGVGLVGTGVKVAADMEQARIGFTNLLGSAQAADRFIRELQGFAAKTPFEFPGLQEAASKFAGAGLSAERVIPIMTALGDSIAAVGGDQNNIAAATRALVQMQQKGRVTGEEMLQLTEAGVSSWGALAKQMGVSIPEAQKKVSAGQVQVNTLLDAISGYAGPLGAVKGMMDAQSGSLKGMLSTLKDVVSQGLAQIAGPIVQGLKDALPALTDSISTLMSVAGPALAEAFGAIIRTVGALLPALAPVLKVFGNFIGQLGKQLAPIAERLAVLFTRLAQPLGEILTALLPLIAPVAELAGKLAELLVPILGVVARVFARIVPVVAKVLGVIGGALAPVIGAILAAFDAVAPAVMSVVDAVADLLAAVAPLIPMLVAALKPILDALLGVLVQLMPALAPLLTMFTRLATLVLPPLIAVLNVVVRALSGPLAAAISTVGGWIAKFLGWIGKLTSSWSSAKGLILGAMGAIRSGIGAALGWISEKWSAIWTGMRDLVSGIWDGIKSIARGAVNFLIRDVINKVISGLNTMVNVIDTALGPFINFPDIPKLPELAALQHGGVAVAPTIAAIGEGRHDEAILPLGGPQLARVAAAIAGAGSGAGALRLIDGKLSFDERGNAFLRGIVAAEQDAERAHAAAVARMRR